MRFRLYQRLEELTSPLPRIPSFRTAWAKPIADPETSAKSVAKGHICCTGGPRIAAAPQQRCGVAHDFLIIFMDLEMKWWAVQGSNL